MLQGRLLMTESSRAPEQELHQLPVGRRQALLEELQGRVTTEGLLQETRARNRRLRRRP